MRVKVRGTVKAQTQVCFSLPCDLPACQTRLWCDVATRTKAAEARGLALELCRDVLTPAQFLGFRRKFTCCGDQNENDRAVRARLTRQASVIGQDLLRCIEVHQRISEQQPCLREQRRSLMNTYTKCHANCSSSTCFSPSFGHVPAKDAQHSK